MRVHLLAALVTVMLSGGISASAELQEIRLTTGLGRTNGSCDEWFIELSVCGSDIANVCLVSPAGSPAGELCLDEFAPGCEGYAEAGGYASLSDLQDDFPTGTYEVFDGATLLGTLDYFPTIPDGSITITFPMHLATGVSLDPTFMFSSSCTNCDNVCVTLETVDVGDDQQHFVECLAPNATSWNSGVALLPSRTYWLSVRSTTEVLNPGGMPDFNGDTFNWIVAAQDDNTIEFTTLGGLLRGDSDGNGIFNALADGLHLLTFGFLGGPPPPCLEAALVHDSTEFLSLGIAVV